MDVEELRREPFEKPLGIRVFPSRQSERIRENSALIHYTLPASPASRARPQFVHHDSLSSTSLSRPPARTTTTTATPMLTDRRPRGVSVPSRHHHHHHPHPHNHHHHHRTEESATRIHTTRIAIGPSTTASPPENVDERASQQTPRLLVKLVSRTSASARPQYQEDVTDDTQKLVYEHLQELDNVLEENDRLTVPEMKRKMEAMRLSFQQLNGGDDEQDEVDETPSDEKTTKEKTEKIERLMRLNERLRGEGYAAPILNEATLSDLRQVAPHGIGGVVRRNAEHKSRVEERRLDAELACRQARETLTPQAFVHQTPTHFSGTNAPIPDWKRLLMAKKLAAAALQDEESRIWVIFRSTSAKQSTEFSASSTSGGHSTRRRTEGTQPRRQVRKHNAHDAMRRRTDERGLALHFSLITA